MGQPNPPGDAPLIEGLGPEWNDVVNYIPEDRRGEFSQALKTRVEDYGKQYEPYKQWDDLQKSGIRADQAAQALQVYSIIENNPKQVYDMLAEHLNITPAQAKDVVGQLDDAIEDDPTNKELQALRQQVETMSQIMVAQNQQTVQQQQQEAEDKRLEAEINAVKKQYGDIPDRHLLMRMLHEGMSADQAAQDYLAEVDKIRATRPAPALMGGSGAIPNRQPINPAKLDGKGTRNLVAQMLDHANAEAKK